MRKEEDHFRDLAEIRSMMERSSRFLSLSGWSGVLAGLYALIGVAIAYYIFHFNPDELYYNSYTSGSVPDKLLKVILLAVLILILAVGTAVYYSYKKAQKRDEKIWNASSRRVLMNMAVPLITGGILIIIFFSNNMVGLIAPFMLLFYGLAIFSVSNFTFNEVRYLGIIEILLGLLNLLLLEFGLLFWAIGFGIMHIVYGIYIHYKYEK